MTQPDAELLDIPPEADLADLARMLEAARPGTEEDADGNDMPAPWTVADVARELSYGGEPWCFTDDQLIALLAWHSAEIAKARAEGYRTGRLSAWGGGKVGEP